MSALGWSCVFYAWFALITFGWAVIITYRDAHDVCTWVARITVSVLWPVYWLGALCIFVADRHLLDTGNGKTEEQDGRHD